MQMCSMGKNIPKEKPANKAYQAVRVILGESLFGLCNFANVLHMKQKL